MNNNEARIWSIVGLLSTIASIAAPIAASYDLNRRGDVPEKSVHLTHVGPLDPLRDLTEFTAGEKFSLVIGGRNYRNLVVEQFTLTNKGASPIVPNDFIEKLTVTAREPWEIVAVRRRELLDPIRIEWIRTKPNQFEAKPFLMNPGDEVSETVYLTQKSGFNGVATIDYLKDNVEVTARIVNLKTFSSTSNLTDLVSTYSSPIVSLTFWNVVLLLLLAALLLYWYANALEASELVRFPSKSAFVAVAAAGVVSFATAESITYYVTGGAGNSWVTSITDFLSWRSQWINWVVLFVHIASSCFLLVRIRRRLRKKQPLPGQAT